MRFLLSFLFILIVIFLLISPFMPSIRQFFSKKVEDFDEYYGDPEEENEDEKPHHHY